MPRPKSLQKPSFEHEHRLTTEGFTAIAGIDEAGRGAWAGPVTAAAVIFPLTAECTRTLALVNDSKQLSVHQRDRCRKLIEQTALCIGEGSATCIEIDQLGIVPATRLAMQRAVAALSVQPDALVIDAVRLSDLHVRQDVFYFADSISLSVAAASIIAKTSRDLYMQYLDSELPGYGFGKHKGYGTRSHQNALTQNGVTRIHRRSYAPIRRLCAIQVQLPVDVII
jgi:ribonuclease HII